MTPGAAFAFDTFSRCVINSMHGYSTPDEKDNLIRLLDFIKGKTLVLMRGQWI